MAKKPKIGDSYTLSGTVTRAREDTGVTVELHGEMVTYKTWPFGDEPDEGSEVEVTAKVVGLRTNAYGDDQMILQMDHLSRRMTMRVE